MSQAASPIKSWLAGADHGNGDAGEYRHPGVAVSRPEDSVWLSELRDTVSDQNAASSFWRRQRTRLALVVAGVLAIGVAGVVVFVVFAVGAASSPRSVTPHRPTVTLVSERQLRQLAGSLGQPIYWTGARTRVSYELTRMPDGRIYLRYLTPGMRLRSSRPALTIGTLPLRHAFAITQQTAKSRHAHTVALAGGGIATLAPGDHQAYLAYPGRDYQAEVYAPLLSTAQTLAFSGQITAIR